MSSLTACDQCGKIAEPRKDLFTEMENPNPWLTIRTMNLADSPAKGEFCGLQCVIDRCTQALAQTPVT